jgi:tRNA threonylcarbamoyladenosine biosynthesis protein TsaB
MRILALSTSTPRGSVAVLADGAAPGAAVYTDLQGHAERVFQAIDEALAAAGIERRAIEAIACDKGPGSFTGVRVGVATGKGIAIGLGIPLVGVVSLEAMAAAAFAEGAAGEGDVVVAAVDAKKDEIFVAAYERAGAPGPGVREIAPPRCAPRSAEALAIAGESRRIVVIGEIAASIDPPPPGLLRGPALDLPDAAWIARLGALRLASADPGEPGDPALIEPLYVRPPDAKPLASATKADRIA